MQFYLPVGLVFFGNLPKKSVEKQVKYKKYLKNVVKR